MNKQLTINDHINTFLKFRDIKLDERTLSQFLFLSDWYCYKNSGTTITKSIWKKDVDGFPIRNDVADKILCNQLSFDEKEVLSHIINTWLSSNQVKRQLIVAGVKPVKLTKIGEIIRFKK